MKFIKSFIIKASAVICCALVLVGCADDGEAPIILPADMNSSVVTDEAKSGGTLRIPMPISPYSMHPLYAREAQMRNVLSVIFEPLVTLDQNMEPSPCLAESWSYSENKWTFTLRSNVHWHGDLGNMNGADAAYTVNKILSDPETVYYEKLAPFVESAEGYDTTLILHVKNPSYALLYALNIPVIPQSYYYNKSADCKDIPRGSGCFCAEALEIGSASHMSLTAFSKWWKKLPYIEKIEVIGYKDTKAMLNALVAGEIDTVPTKMKTTEIYEIRDGISYKNYLSYNYVFLAFNMARPIMADSDFRYAIAYAINRTDIINNVYLTKASGTGQPLFNDSSLSSAEEMRYDHNESKAKTLIDGLNYSDTDGNGFVEKNGTDITLTLAVINTPEDPIRLQAAESIKRDLAGIGINVELLSLSQEELLQTVEKGDYDMILSGYYLSDLPDLKFAFQGGAGDLSRYSSERMNEAIALCDGASSLEELKRGMLEFQRVFADELPQIGLFFEMNTFLYNERLVTGTVQRESNVYSTINTWYIKQ